MKPLRIYSCPVRPSLAVIGILVAGLVLSILVLLYLLHPAILQKRFSYQVSSDFTNLTRVATEIKTEIIKQDTLNRAYPVHLFSTIDELSSPANAEALVFSGSRAEPKLWTTNEFVFTRQEIKASGKFLENNSGIFLVHKDSIPGYLIVAFKPILIKYLIQNQYFTDQAANDYKNFGAFSLRLIHGEKSPKKNVENVGYKVEFLHPATGCRIMVFLLLSVAAFFVFRLLNIINICFVRNIRLVFAFKFLITVFILIFYNYFFKSLLGSYFSETGSSLAVLYLRITTQTFLIGCLFFVYDVYALTTKQLFGIQKARSKYFIIFVNSFTIVFITILIFWILEDVVESAMVDFDSSVFMGLTFYSVTILLGIGLLLTALSRLMNFFYFFPDRQSDRLYLILLLFASILSVVLGIFKYKFLFYCGLFFLMIVVFAYINQKGFFKSVSVISSFILLILSFSSSMLLNNIQANKEKSRQQLILYTIDSKEAGDPITSHLFMDRVPLIRSDTFLINQLIKERQYEEAQEYIRSRHFSGYWDQFNITVTVCYQEDSIRISPNMTKEGCFDYFHQYQLKNKDLKKATDLYLVEYGQNLSGYFGIISTGNVGDARIFIELIPKSILRNVNLSEILTDRRTPARIDLGNYSFARYTNGQLVSHRGVVSFPFVLPERFITGQKEMNIVKDGIVYSVLNSSNGSTYIICKEGNFVVNFFAIFSLLFILSAIGFLVFQAGIFSNESLKGIFFDFLSVRLQVFIVLVLVVSLLVLGVFFIKTYSDIYRKRFSSGIIEKAHSLAIEFQHKIEQYGDSWVQNKQMTQAFSIKLGNIFFTDIHLFDSQGSLLTTTSPVLFDRAISAPRIHPQAFQHLYLEQKPFFVQKETIGTYDFYSGYMPLRNSNHQLLAVINLPQISQIPEMDYEATKFISTFISIYTFLIILAVLLTLLLSNQIVKPLVFLKNSLAELKIGRKNVKIQLKRKDEIGQLIDLYNELVDRLESAIQELKIRERELAWRDVARQIAHEIRNPLTPIKLQIQFLARSYEPQNPEWQARYISFSKTLLDQIEVLEQLANSFSEFVKMPEQKWEKVNLYKLLKDTIDLYENFGGQIFLEADDNRHNLIVKGDYQQIKRLFVNLIKNAIQSISQPEKGIVRVTVQPAPDGVHIVIKDNGTGISAELAEKIFMPNFTTKSSGMGLGLYIAKNIVEQHNGVIRFESQSGKGTIFTVILPLAQNAIFD